MVTIGLTPEVDEINKRLMRKFGFDTEKDMALFAFAYAIKENILCETVTNKGTKWGTSSFEDIDYEKILQICYPDTKMDDPLLYFVELMHAGIRQINNLVSREPDLMISDLLPKE
ncbi:MAG: hypothetical protein WC179_09125 [Candidatus Cloacimonadaceae bacterium]